MIIEQKHSLRGIQATNTSVQGLKVFIENRICKFFSLIMKWKLRPQELQTSCILFNTHQKLK